MSTNLDKKTVDSFGEEWSYFDQSAISSEELRKIFQEYFSIFPWESITNKSIGFDMGCGSGRWAQFVAPRVKKLHCIDPSDAIEIAKKNLSSFENVSFHQASLSDSTLEHESQDFGYSLGVLHHVPDAQAAIKSCVDLLKPNAPFLLYIYYAFDNRPWWFRIIWKISDVLRKIIILLPDRFKFLVTDLLAILVYWPLSRFCRLLDMIGFSATNFPLFYYRNHSIYTMRTDARDRFGTPLETRYNREEIALMMEESGLQEVKFSDGPPFWCAVGIKR